VAGGGWCAGWPVGGRRPSGPADGGAAGWRPGDPIGLWGGVLVGLQGGGSGEWQPCHLAGGALAGLWYGGLVGCSPSVLSVYREVEKTSMS
jgi:hypothetical protein